MPRTVKREWSVHAVDILRRGKPTIPLSPEGSRLSAGDRLGPYVIEALLGAGGMGEVFRATDTRLGRTVAIKVLAAQVAAREELRRRFEVEARAIASLNHPQICALFDVGQQGDVAYMVMEHRDGESLAVRLRKSPLPLADALRYGVQIAQALEQAHRRGIVHRDIKPGNIMLTRTGPKLLDFGLARLRDNSMADGDPTRAVTQQGVVLGTPQYMAPEQIAGEEADARSDLFSFGIVLYEMVNGQRASAVAGQPALMAAILSGAAPPPLTAVPSALNRAIMTCLARDPDERWQSAGDLRRELAWIAEGGDRAVAQTVRSLGRREMLAWGTAAVFGAAGIAAAVRARGPAAPAIRRTTFNITVPPGASLNPFSSPPAISPDGRMIAFSVATDGSPRIWLRSLDSLTARALPGTENANSFFWAPDSRSIGFCVLPNVLKRVEVAGGAPQTLCEAKGRITGGAWNREGVILFNFGLPEALYQIQASGGSPRPVTSLAPHGHVAHVYPGFLPDGRRFVFTALSKDPERQGTYLGSLDSSDIERLSSAGSNAVYASPGFLVFVQGKKILAQAFDARRIRLAGEPTVVADGVWTMTGMGVVQADFSVSDTGTLVFTDAGVLSGQLTWIDRSGRRLGLVGSPGPFIHLDLSPDETRVLLERYDPELAKGDLWVLDLARGGALFRVTSGPDWSYQGFWSNDGERIVYAKSGVESTGNVIVRDASGVGQEMVLTRDAMPSDWSRDGRFILFGRSPGATELGIWAQPLADPARAIAVLRGDAAGLLLAHGARLSPDGRWMVYVSNESGTPDVYVTPFPSAEGKWPISTDGGSQPRWRDDGKELYYLARDRTLMAVSVSTSARFRAGPPVPLFALHGVEYFGTRCDYAPTRGGQRFLVNVGLSKLDSNSLTVIDGWQSGLAR